MNMVCLKAYHAKKRDKPITHFQQNDRGSYESSALPKPSREKPHDLLMHPKSTWNM